MNEITKYHNDMNSVALRKFNAREIDLFFTICSKLKNEGMDEVTFNFLDLKELSGVTSSTVEEFIKLIDDVYSKILQLNIRIGNDVDFIRFNLFSEYEVKGSSQEIIIKTNEKFKWVLNELTGNFTRFELKEFVDLKSSYTKECYRRLKQFRNTGYWRVEIEEFKRILDIPKSYAMRDINKRVFNPIQEELTPIFKGLKINKIKSKKRGNPVTHIEFRFEPQKYTDYDEAGELKLSSNQDITEEERQQLRWIAQKILKEVDIDIEKYVELQIEYSKLHSPNHLYQYTKKSVEQDYAKALEQLGAQENMFYLRQQKPQKTKFHNFKQITDNYTEEELEEVARRKRKEFYDKLGSNI